MSILTIAKILNVKSQVQKKIIDILYPLQGYSKRLDLLEDQLSKELPGKNNFRSIKTNIKMMQELGLAATKESTAGTRFYLDKQIWCYPPQLYELLRGLAFKLYESSRSDIKFEGLLKKYKSKAISRNYKLRKLPHKFWRVTLANFLKNENFENLNNIELKEENKSDGIGNTETLVRKNFRSLPKDLEIEQIDQGDLEKVILYDDIFPLNLKDSVEPVLIKIFPTLNYLSNIIRIRIPLALGRSQQVFVTVRQSVSFSRILWVYTLSGDLSKTKTPLLDLFRLNNDANPIKVAPKAFYNTEFLVCAVPINLKDNWEDKIKDLIIKVARYGDLIESTFWHEDHF